MTNTISYRGASSNTRQRALKPNLCATDNKFCEVESKRRLMVASEVALEIDSC
jgi:hypothetical protein